MTHPRIDLIQKELCQKSKQDSNLPNSWNFVVPARIAADMEAALINAGLLSPTIGPEYADLPLTCITSDVAQLDKKPSTGEYWYIVYKLVGYGIGSEKHLVTCTRPADLVISRLRGGEAVLVLYAEQITLEQYNEMRRVMP